MDFPPNSNKARERPTDATHEKPEEKKLEAVVTGEVVRRKKPLGRRFKETFLGGDAKGVLGFVMLDVMIPAAKDMMADAVSQGIERMLFGEARSTSRRPRSGGGNGYVSYNRYSSNTPRDGRREEPRSVSRGARARHDFDEIILATRVEAEEVIDRLSDLVQRYESATVADLYDLVGVSGSYTDDKWGWTDIRGATVQRIRNGYLLDLPKPDYLER
jgi:hypothetical protein